MTALSSPLPVCPLPACRNTTTAAGQPCSECVEAFGTALQPAPERDVDEATIVRELAERDEAVRNQLARQALVSLTPYQRKVVGVIRKPNQRCWLCDDRHTCVLTERGWECDTCRSIE